MADDIDEARGTQVDVAEAITRAARNAASIAAIPWEELPDGAARGCLLEMAYAGGNVSASQAADGRWRIRIDSQVELCDVWAARFHV